MGNKFLKSVDYSSTLQEDLNESPCRDKSSRCQERNFGRVSRASPKSWPNWSVCFLLFGLNTKLVLNLLILANISKKTILEAHVPIAAAPVQNASLDDSRRPEHETARAGKGFLVFHVECQTSFLDFVSCSQTTQEGLNAGRIRGASRASSCPYWSVCFLFFSH